MSGEPRGRCQTAARTAGQPPGEAGRRGLLWGAHLIGVGDVPGVGQHEGAELVEILHGSLALLRGLQGTAPQGQTVPAHPVPAPADGRTDRRTDRRGPRAAAPPPARRATRAARSLRPPPRGTPSSAGTVSQCRGSPGIPGTGGGAKSGGRRSGRRAPTPLRHGAGSGAGGTGAGTAPTAPPPPRTAPARPVPADT